MLGTQKLFELKLATTLYCRRQACGFEKYDILTHHVR